MSFSDAAAALLLEKVRKQIPAIDDSDAAEVDLRPSASWAKSGPPLGGDGLTIVESFHLGMVDLPTQGAHLLIQPLSKAEAVQLANRQPHHVVASSERGQSMLEQSLELEPGKRASVRYGSRMLVAQFIKWNDIRFYLVTWESDGHGCIP